MSARFVFAGNRPFVLQELMGRRIIPDPIYAVEGSYLQRHLEAEGISFKVMPKKKAFIGELNELEFDYFIANGLPVILPITELTSGTSKRFINVHPSPLPDLRGADPIPGAILFGRDSGATCHLMDDGVDTGAIIAREVIPFSTDLDAGLIYQLCFEAEARVFREALDSNFQARESQHPTGDEVYYSFSPDDLRIRFDESANQIVRRIRAFNNRSKGAWFNFEGECYRVFDAEHVTNPFFGHCFAGAENRTVVLNYEGMLIVRIDDGFVRLKEIDKAIDAIPAGSRLD